MKNRTLIESLEARQLLAADFTLVAVSDTQYTVESFPDIFRAQTNWAKANAAFFAVQGDMLRRGYSNAQAQTAQGALDVMNGLVPYTVSIGNHDYDNQFDDLDHHISSASFTGYFGDAMFARQGGGGFVGSSLDQRNRYQVVTLGGQEFMVLSLEWAAPDNSIAWAQKVIDAHPNTPTIISTHEYLSSAGRTTSTLDPLGNSGEDIWQKLVRANPSIFLVLSGHSGSLRHQTSINDAGLPVHETVSDFEGRAYGGNGYMHLFNFKPGEDKVVVTAYSPHLNQTDASASYELPLDYATRFNLNQPVVPFNPFSNAPIAVADALLVEEGESATLDVTLNDSDTDGDAVSAVLSSLPAHGAVFVNPNGTFTYHPDPKYTGADSFSYYPVDGQVRGAPVQVTVTVLDTDVRYNYPINSPALAASGDGQTEFRTAAGSWQFNVTGGEQVSFAVNAWRDWSSNEYKFQYSTNNSTWYDMTQIVPASSRSVTRTGFDADEPYQLWRLPASLAGTLYVKMVSTENQSAGWRATLDEMFVMNTGTLPAPAAPSLLTGSYSRKTGKATLKWRDNATNETGYKVWYSTNGGTTWDFWTLPANSRSYVTPTLTKGVTYLFKVSAYNANGDSAFSNTISLLAT